MSDLVTLQHAMDFSLFPCMFSYSMCGLRICAILPSYIERVTSEPGVHIRNTNEHVFLVTVPFDMFLSSPLLSVPLHFTLSV